MRARRSGALFTGLGALAWLGGAVAAEREHVVRPGESLAGIAVRLTGDPARWPEIYRANRDQIKDPSLLYPGQRLAIPDFEDPAPDEDEAAPDD